MITLRASRATLRALSFAMLAVIALASGAAAQKKPTGIGIIKLAGDPADTYEVDAANMQCRETWYHYLGGRDLVLMSVQVYDTGSPDSARAVAFSFVCSDDEVFPLQLTRLWGPSKLPRGQLKVEGKFMVTSVSHFDNVRDAMKKLASVSGTVLDSVGTATGKKELLVVGKLLSIPNVSNAVGDFLAEVAQTIGTVTCAGNNPLTWTGAVDFQIQNGAIVQNANKEFQLWYLTRGAQASTCWREIKYTLVGRSLKPVSTR
jgi:hypothetical protein